MVFNFLIILYLIFFAYLSFIRLEWAVLFLLASLPSYLIRFQIFGIPFTLLEAMILVSFFVWFVFQTEFRNFIKGRYGWKDFQENRKERMLYPFGLEIILLLVVSFVAVAVAGFSDSAFGIWKAYFFEPALLFILILNVFANEKYKYTNNANDTDNTNSNLEKVILAFAVSAFAVSVLAIYQQITGAWIFNDFWADSANRRVVSFFGYPNAVGLYLAPLILIFVGWLSSAILIRKAEEFRGSIRKTGFFASAQNDKWKLFFVFATIVLSFFAIYFSKSKGALVGVAIGLGVFFLLSVGKKIKWVVVLLALILGVGVLAYAPARNFALEKTIYSKSFQIREQQWKETWEMLQDGRLISGAGLANYREAVALYHQEGIFLRDYSDPDWHKKTVFNAEYRASVWQPTEIYLYPHNIFLNFWSELGLAGVLLFIWIIVKYIAYSFKLLAVRDDRNEFIILGLFCAMVVIIVHGLVDVPYFKNDLAVVFWVLVAMVFAQRVTHNA